MLEIGSKMSSQSFSNDLSVSVMKGMFKVKNSMEAVNFSAPPQKKT
jgi:hypothetical protein